MFRKASRRVGNAEVVLNAALASLRRCVIVDHFDVTNYGDWRCQAPEVLSAWFPWLRKHKDIPVEQPPDSHQKSHRMPYRLMQVLEELNDLDMVIYREALELMRLQKEALQGGKVGLSSVSQLSGTCKYSSIK